MRTMRIRAVVLALLFLVLPIPAAAEFISMGPSGSCPKGTAGDPSGPPKSFSFSSSATEVRSYLNRRVLCPSACFDEAVTLNLSTSGITVTIAAQNKCGKTELDPRGEDAKKNNRGCAKGQTSPRVVVKITGLKEQTIPPKSRCDASNLSRVIDSVAEQRLGEALAGLSALAAPVVGVAPIAAINLGTAAGQKILSEQLATAFQITPDRAEAIVAKDPQAAIRAIYAVSQGDDAAIKAEAESLGLNANLADTVGLRAKLIKDGNLTDPDESGILGIGDNTFRDAGVASPQVLVRDVLYSGQGGCYAVSNSHGTFRPCVMTQDQVAQVRGNIIPQVASVYWEGNQRADGQPFNANALGVAHQTLPLGTQVLVYNPQTGQAVVATVNDRGPFVSGRDIDLSRGTANAIGFNGVGAVQTVILGSSMPTGTLGQYASVADAFKAYQASNGTIAVGAGDIASGVPRNTSPFANLFGGSTGAYMNTSSPFSPPPVPIAQPAAYSQPQQTTPAPQAGTSPAVTPQPRPSTQAPTSTVAQELERALQDPASVRAGGLMAHIVVQESEVARGSPVHVSWTSVGMSTTTPCAVRADSRVVARGNEGTSVVQTSAATRIGSLVFYLACTTPSGATFQRTAATMVR